MGWHEGFFHPGIVGYGSGVGCGEAEDCRAQVPYTTGERLGYYHIMVRCLC